MVSFLGFLHMHKYEKVIFLKALGEGSDIGGEGCLQEGVAGLSVDCAPSSPSPASSVCI